MKINKEGKILAVVKYKLEYYLFKKKFIKISNFRF